MEPKLIERKAFQVLGILAQIEPTKADYGSIWKNKYMPHNDMVSKLAVDKGYYSLYFSSEVQGKVSFVAGMAVDNIGNIPPGLVLKEVPGGEFAQVECKLNEIGQTWGAIYRDWLPFSIKHAEDESKTSFEYFPPGADQGKVLVSINVPLKAK